jgi:hypothetical protein
VCPRRTWHANREGHLWRKGQRVYKHVELELTFERANAIGKLLDLFVEFFGGC